MDQGPAEVTLGKDLKTLFESGLLLTLTDAGLLERFSAAHSTMAEAAFATLVERHGRMVLGVCRRILHDSHLAEDATQATFLILARRAPKIPEGHSLGPWLHRVAWRVSLRARKHVENRRRGISQHEIAADRADVRIVLRDDAEEPE